MDYEIFEKGSCGYAPQGGDGENGENGHSVYYSAFSSDSSTTIMTYISARKELTNNINITNTVEYNAGDLIICSDGVVFLIKHVGTNMPSEIKNMGSIIYRNEDVPVSSTLDLDSSVTFFVHSIDSSIINDYNRVSISDNSKSPLYHHRTAYKENSRCICIDSSIGYMKGNDAKICILFNNGLSYSSPCTDNNNPDVFYIDVGYFFPYGKWNDNNYWGDWDQSNYDCSMESEFSNEMAIVCSKMLYDSSLCACSAYIESNITDNDSSITMMYRVPINFQNTELI